MVLAWFWRCGRKREIDVAGIVAAGRGEEKRREEKRREERMIGRRRVRQVRQVREDHHSFDEAAARVLGRVAPTEFDCPSPRGMAGFCAEKVARNAPQFWENGVWLERP